MCGPCVALVAVDETYVGGKRRKGTPGEPLYGRATKKQAVVALVERDGRVRTRLMVRPDKNSLREAIREVVHPTATIHTDEYSAYHGIGDYFLGGHKTVAHSRGEYARDGVHVNDAEAFFALFKRGIVGSFHSISRKHMPRYLTEFSFRWDHRKRTDGERTAAAIKGVEGKRLMYRDPVGK